jgi:hypothetical protein
MYGDDLQIWLKFNNNHSCRFRDNHNYALWGTYFWSYSVQIHHIANIILSAEDK